MRGREDERDERKEGGSVSEERVDKVGKGRGVGWRERSELVKVGLGQQRQEPVRRRVKDVLSLMKANETRW
jgi:hypothetical protein